MAPNPLTETIRTARQAGITVWPPLDDGSKRPVSLPLYLDDDDQPTFRDTGRPLLGDNGRQDHGWKPVQDEGVTVEQLRAFYGDGKRTGVGFITGHISGDLELFEFDESLLDAFTEHCDAAGLGDPWRRVVDGYLEETPGGGWHTFERCPAVTGNLKLAQRPTRPEERTNPNDKVRVLIETRGEGGFAVVAPSNGTVHPTGGAYRLVKGGPATIATITEEEREALFAVARSFDQMPRSTFTLPPASDGTWIVRPGDDFNTLGDWERDILFPAGWTFAYERGARRHYRRPGKTDGISGNVKDDLFYCFTSSTPLNSSRAYAKFGAYGVLLHDGNFTAAANALAKQGYGKAAATNSEDSGNSGTAPPTPEPWEPPIPLGEYERPNFPVEVLPGWLANVVDAEATATQTPPDLAGSLSLACLGAAAGGRVEVAVGDGWREPVNIYVVSVLASGNRKSAILRDMADPLYSRERDLIAEKRETIAVARNQRAIKEQALAHAQALAAKATTDKDRLTAEGDADSLARALATTIVPSVPRLLVDDTTPEKLTSILAEQGGRLAVLSPEGDLFDTLAGRYSNGVANLGAVLKAHAGDPITVDRQGRPSEHITRPALTIGLAVQPDVLKGLADKPGFRGRGLLARFLYSLPLSTVGQRQINPPPVTLKVMQDYRTRLGTLLALPMGTDIDGSPAPHVLRLSPAASARFEQYQQVTEPRLGEFGDLGHCADWGGKLCGAVARLAGLLHLAEHALAPAPWETPISDATMESAIDLGDYFAAHALVAFALIGADPDVEDARTILRWLEREHRAVVTKRDIYQATKGRFKRVEALEPALEVLVRHGYLREQPAAERPGPGRRPSPTYEVNPHSHNSHYPHNSEPD